MSFLSDFDKLMEGGLKHNTVYLIKGPSFSGKSIFCLKTALEKISEGAIAVYVTTELAPRELKKNVMQGFKIDLEELEKKGLLKFVDAYSWRLEKDANVLRVTDLAEASRMLCEVCDQLDHEKKKHFLVLDSLSTFILYNDFKAVIKWIELIIARMRDRQVSGFIVVEEGIHDKTVIETLQFFVDGIFETGLLEVEGSLERRFRVLGLRTGGHKTDWIPFEINQQDLFKFKSEELAEEAHGIFKSQQEALK